MRTLLTLLCFLVISRAQAQHLQAPPDSTGVNLSVYTPTQYGQYKGTCYAYATTYTALSIEYNVQKSITGNRAVNRNAFSATFTASLVPPGQMHL